jgi:hypothetical protein
VRRRAWPVVVAAVAGLGIGATLGVVAAPTPAPQTAPYAWNESLRVFDRPGQTVPDGVRPPADPTIAERQAEVRYLGAVELGHVFVSRATLRDGSAHLCLHVVDDGVGSATCTSETEFRRIGLALFTGDLGVAWSPIGNVLSEPSPPES